MMANDVQEMWLRKYIKNGVAGIVVTIVLMILLWLVSDHTSTSYNFYLILFIVSLIIIILLPVLGIIFNVKDQKYKVGFWVNIFLLILIVSFLIFIGYQTYFSPFRKIGSFG